MINADLLLMITSTDGLYDKDPAFEGASRIKHVPFNNDFSNINFEGKTNVGRGGMESKIQAVSKITPLGIKAIISTKERERIIVDALCGDGGTYFSPKSEYNPEQRKAWLLSMRKPNCYIEVDKGAFSALVDCKSLLPKGIVNVSGEFYRGDCIEIICNGYVFASGVCEYNHMDIKQIMGTHSSNIEDILGYKTSCEVVHTGNLVIEKDLEYEKIS